MSELINKVRFEILINDSFSTINTEAELNPVDNKNVLSVINDFEDGNWRYEKFQNFIWDNIKETALSAQERENLIDQERSRLISAAQKIRLTDGEDDNGQGSELAEIMLYGIMKHHYKALPVVPKIFYKQNSKDFAKGSDSVHIVIEENDFTIWFGEAKFYNSIEDARLTSIVQSVENSLQKEKLEKENSIITGLTDLNILIDDEDLRNKIKAAITPGVSMDSLKPKLHIPILLLHECSITQDLDSLTDEYRNSIVDFHKDRAQAYFKKQINKFGSSLFKYNEITFHIILFPIPSKERIVSEFISEVRHYQKKEE